MSITLFSGCPLLPNPINGAVAQTGIVPGSKATYTCDIGFAVVGSGGHTCQEDGKWSVSSAPICEASKLTDKTHTHT